MTKNPNADLVTQLRAWQADMLSDRVSILKPQNLIQAAQADLERREGEWGQELLRLTYAFAREHVQRATDVKHLLMLAIGDSGVLDRLELQGAPKPKRSTRLLYSAGAKPLLEAAIAMLEQENNVCC